MGVNTRVQLCQCLCQMTCVEPIKMLSVGRSVSVGPIAVVGLSLCTKVVLAVRDRWALVLLSLPTVNESLGCDSLKRQSLLALYCIFFICLFHFRSFRSLTASLQFGSPIGPCNLFQHIQELRKVKYVCCNLFLGLTCQFLATFHIVLGGR